MIPGRLNGRPMPASVGAGLLAIAVFGSGKLGIDLSRFTADVATIWLSNAIPLAIMLVRPRRVWWL